MVMQLYCCDRRAAEVGEHIEAKHRCQVFFAVSSSDMFGVTFTKGFRMPKRAAVAAGVNCVWKYGQLSILSMVGMEICVCIAQLNVGKQDIECRSISTLHTCRQAAVHT